MSNTGIAIVDLENNKPVLVDSVPTKKNNNLTETEDHKARLKKITDKYDELLHNYLPEEVTMESPFVMHNKSTKAIMKVHGITQRWFASFPQFYYAPTTLKMCVTGNGKSSKEALQRKLINTYNIEFKNEDESDALACAVVHLIKTKRIKSKKL